SGAGPAGRTGAPPGAVSARRNASGARIVGVARGGGINATRGAVMGAAVRASRSVTFFRRKVGHVLLPGRSHCGPVEVADIGIKAQVLAQLRPRAVLNDPGLWRASFPLPRADGPKYSRGHAAVVSG